MQQQRAPVRWVSDPPQGIELIDQTALPAHEAVLRITTVDDLIGAVQRLVVRGAPTLGVAGALGVALAVAQAERERWPDGRLELEIARLRAARPTAVNLAWGVDQVVPAVGAGLEPTLEAALTVLRDAEAATEQIAKEGAGWMLDHVSERPLRVLTHCNAGPLAATGVGTALGVIGELHARGALDMVYVDETRPLLQGSRLTAWELQQAGIAYRIQVDGAAAATITQGLVDAVVIGADRIAANGDVANKIGSLGLALACDYARIPLVVAAPMSTIDFATEVGGAMTIEQRYGDEVLQLSAPVGAVAHNPAFDVTPGALIEAIVTERGVAQPKTDDGALRMLAGSVR